MIYSINGNCKTIRSMKAYMYDWSWSERCTCTKNFQNLMHIFRMMDQQILLQVIRHITSQLRMLVLLSTPQPLMVTVTFHEPLYVFCICEML
ncbi:hypothetical protein HanOQP8_Chr05g0181961 [Helianthus annuus]|nr:hypothetical protein HanOQP8_Chr05g0181961 [Helianthus annuus]